MAIGFGSQGLFKYDKWTSIVLCVATLTAGSAILMWLGEQITEKGVGNGISIVLLINIVSSLPEDLMTLYERFVQNSSVAMKVVAIVIMVACTIAMVAFTVLLQEAQRKIPVQYAKKMQGRKMVGGQSSHIPLKVNTAGVIPVIFASSLLSFPVVIAQFFNVDYSTIGGKIILTLNSGNWFNSENPIYSIGYLIYAVLIILFAYFYTSITFNPVEVANNMKKQGGFVPGIRPGKPTSDYLTRILNYIIFIGAAGLLIVCTIPIIITGIFNVSRMSFMGTSLIIIVGVVLETLKQIEAQMTVRNYKGFLNV
jgi:preprotein translocase subunit SecY